MRIKDIINEGIKGWKHAGIQWRIEFVEKGIDPDKFRALPDSDTLLKRYLSLDRYRRDTFLLCLKQRFSMLRLRLL